MKTIKLFSLSIVLVVLTSCTASSFYQIYSVVPTDNSSIQNKTTSLVYSDANCDISYNFWTGGGTAGFLFYNKTDQNIYVHLNETFFILNGIANDYYQNRVFTASSGATVGNTRVSSGSTINTASYPFDTHTRVESTTRVSSAAVTSSKSTSYIEEPIICIPAHSAKLISEFSIMNSIVRSCDLTLRPRIKEPTSMKFNKENSPLVFSNRITYTLGKEETKIVVNNEFFIAEISNLNTQDVVFLEYIEHCGKKDVAATKLMKNVSADKFYLVYKLGVPTFWIE